MEQDEDDYVSFGTPLPELEDESVLRKKAAKELEVRDEKGRQRFHGAFTGGFSAGYFNTVGTKEGWAPSTFVSSRNKTAERFQQNPEDFMDEEDLGEFGISTRRIQTTSKFSDSSDLKTNKRKYTEVDSIIPGEAPLKDLVKPISESIGIEILKKLGWKLGQGIGPRVKKDAATKIYGCSPFPDNSVTNEDDPASLSFTFAPKDIEAAIYSPKDDVFGLGYTGLSKQSILGPQIDTFNPTFTKSFLKKDKKKLTISGQAFGVGAFEDDDEDIYSKDDMAQYDFSELGANTSGQMTSKKECKQMGSLEQMLEGFRLATEPPPIKKYYPPPNLPPDYKPIRSSIPKIPIPVEPQFTSRHALSSGDRSVLLGEKKFQSFIINKDKTNVEKKIDTITNQMPVASSKHTFRPFPNDPLKQQRYEEYLKLKESQEVDKLIQPPSMTEWEKQQELEEFARAAILFKPLSAALSSKFESKSHLSVEHEVMEAIAKSKKESESSKASVDKRKLVGLSKRTTLDWHPASLLCKRFNVPNPYPNSSEVSGSQKSKSLFDHISFENRESLPNTSIPAPSESNTSTKAYAEPYKPVRSTINIKETSSNVVLSSMDKSVQESSTEIKKPPIDFFKDIFENSSSDEEDSSQTEPPTKDLNLSPKSLTTEKDIGSTISACPNDLKDPKHGKENKKAGFGVFANLDLDALNQRTPVVKGGSDTKDCIMIDSSRNISNETKSVSGLPTPLAGSLSPRTSLVKGNEKSNCETINEVKTSESLSDKMEVCISPPSEINTSLAFDNLYGPELPPNYSVPTVSTTSKSIHKKHSKHKTKHKHKHNKHKSKKKKKKQSSHKSSDESSFASDEDIPPTVILEKLKKLQKVLKSDH